MAEGHLAKARQDSETESQEAWCGLSHNHWVLLLQSCPKGIRRRVPRTRGPKDPRPK